MCEETAKHREYVRLYHIRYDDLKDVEVALCDQHDRELRKFLDKTPVIKGKSGDLPLVPPGKDPNPPPTKPPRRRRT